MAEHRDEPDHASDVLVVALYCRTCSRPVALTYRPDGYHTGAWSCPYDDCRQIQKIDLPGDIVRVVPIQPKP